MALAPKIMHFIWIGNPIPDKYVANILAWQKYNPDYEVKLWIDTATTPPARVTEAIEKAQLPNVEVLDLNGSAKHLFENAETRAFYNDEATGQHANYAAACDLLRLEILEAEGGVYIDVDTLPKEDRPLGNIEIDDRLGFCKPPGNTNDVLAALPRSPFVHKVKEKALEAYTTAYRVGGAEGVDEKVDLHRSKRPWKQRTETTLEWAGPNAYIDVLQEFEAKMPDQAARKSLIDSVMSKDLSQKFITESDQNWRDKGPQNPKEQHEYFKEEMLFRLKHQCEKELKDLFQSLPSNSPERGLLHSLITKLERSHETMPIKDIFHSWIKSAKIEGIPQNIVDLIERTKSIADRLNASELSPQQITALKTNLFPKERYRLISPDSSDTELNKQFIRSNMTMREIHEQFFEIAPIPWIQRMTQFVSSLIFQEPPAPYRIDPHIQHASAGVADQRPSSTAHILESMPPSERPRHEEQDVDEARVLDGKEVVGALSRERVESSAPLPRQDSLENENDNDQNIPPKSSV